MVFLPVVSRGSTCSTKHLAFEAHAPPRRTEAPGIAWEGPVIPRLLVKIYHSSTIVHGKIPKFDPLKPPENAG